MHSTFFQTMTPLIYVDVFHVNIGSEESDRYSLVNKGGWCEEEVNPL